MIDFVIIDLKAEISQLELCCNKADENQLPPYLVPDSKVLCNNLRTIQDAVRTNKSIIIIPLAVIDDLDAMKKETKLARDAIRWLESQFRQGNRSIDILI
jgi:protein SMG5